MICDNANRKNKKDWQMLCVFLNLTREELPFYWTSLQFCLALVRLIKQSDKLRGTLYQKMKKESLEFKGWGRSKLTLTIYSEVLILPL